MHPDHRCRHMMPPQLPIVAGMGGHFASEVFVTSHRMSQVFRKCVAHLRVAPDRA